MPARRKNLLEAFSRSAAAPPVPQAAAPRPATPELPLFEAAAGRPVKRRPVPALVGIALLLAFALGFWLGRSQPEEVEAGPTLPARAAPPETQPRSFQGGPPPAAAAGVEAPRAPAAEERIEDSALFDPANLYTVVVAAYANTNDDLAWSTHEFLRESGVPVFKPVASKNLILVVAGAAPTAAELERTVQAVQRLERRGARVFPDAYLARIDQIIPRTTPKKP
jgi:hypothetical protein